MPLVSKTFSQIITFTRASTGTFFDSAGVLTSAAIDAPRFDYNPATLAAQGLLIEEQRTNLLTYSEQFDNAASWAVTGAGGTVTANQAVAPDGNTTADQLTFTANAVSGVRQNVTLTAVSHTLSCWMRSISGTATARLKYFNGTTDTFSSDFTLTTTWQRFSFTFTGVAVAGNISINNGTAGAIQNIYIWGAQLNPTPVLGGITESLSTYYPTTASAYYGPRLDYDPVTLAAQGLLIEEQRTNSLLQSQTFNTTWTASAGTTITADSINAPTGTQVADTITAATANSDNISQNLTLAASTTYTLSFFIKNNTATRSFFRLIGFNSGSTNSQVTINWTGATLVSATGGGTTIVATQTLLNDWYRVAITFTTNASDGGGVSTVQLYPELIQSSRSIYLFGAQLEAGAFPTSYIPTTTTALTRNADVATVSPLGSWFNSAAGTIYAEFSIPAATASRSQATFGDGTANERMIISNNTSLTGTAWRIVDGGVDQADINNNTSFANNATVKVAGAYAVNDFATSQNGGTVGTDTSGTLPTVTALYLGSNGAAQYASSHLRRITYYPVRLTNAALQQITT